MSTPEYFKSSEMDLDSLRIENCIPNCLKCPGMWQNVIINHKIVCNCCRNRHKGVKNEV